MLSLNFPRILVADYPSFIEVVVCNDTGFPLRDAAVVLDCPMLGLNGKREQLPDLADGQQTVRHIDVTPQRAGSQPVRCTLEIIDGRSAVQLIGVCGSYLIYEKPENLNSLSIVVQDIQSHRSDGDKGEFGSIKGDVSLNFTDLVNIKSVNDLLRVQLPDAYQPVLLERSTAGSTQATYLSIPGPFLNVFEPVDVAMLTPHHPDLGAIRISSFNAEVLLGRNGEAVDLVTHFMPADAENQKRTQLLSRVHAKLSLSGHPLMLQASAISANSLVCVGSTAVRPGDTAKLPDLEMLTLGAPPADFRIRCAVRSQNPPRPIRIANLQKWIGQRTTESFAETDEQDSGRVDLDLTNSQPARWRLQWFHRSVSFGRSKGANITFDLPSLDAIHGYLHHRRGTFWIECASPSSHSIVVNDYPLADGDILPLKDGNTLLIGGERIDYGRIR